MCQRKINSYLKELISVLTASTCRCMLSSHLLIYSLILHLKHTQGTQDILWSFLRALWWETPSPQQQEACSCCGPIFPFTTSLWLKKALNWQRTIYMQNLKQVTFKLKLIYVQNTIFFACWTQNWVSAGFILVMLLNEENGAEMGVMAHLCAPVPRGVVI